MDEDHILEALSALTRNMRDSMLIILSVKKDQAYDDLKAEHSPEGRATIQRHIDCVVEFSTLIVKANIEEDNTINA